MTFSAADRKRLEAQISKTEGKPMAIDWAEVEKSGVIVAEEKIVKTSQKVSFADVVLPDRIAKRGYADTHIVTVGDKVHSTHPDKERALQTAQECMRAGAEDVSVKALSEDEAKAAQLRKGPRVAEDDQMSDDDRKARGIKAKDAANGDPDSDADDDLPDRDDDGTFKRAGRVLRTGKAAKVSKAGVFDSWLDGSMHKVAEYDLSDTSRDGKLDPADEGEDALNREYADGVLERLGGGNVSGTRGDVIPDAGAGGRFEGDTRSTGNAGFRPMPGGEGNRGRAGGEDGHGTGSAEPNLRRSGAYSLEIEGAEPSTAVVRSGPNFIMPGKGGGGVESLSEFLAPDARTTPTLKSESGREPVKKEARKGLFRNVGGMDFGTPGDQNGHR